MSYLRQLSSSSNDKAKTEPVTTRLTKGEFEAFTTLCNETGFSVAEALRLLIQKELSDTSDTVYKNDDKMLQNVYEIDDKPQQNVYKRIRTGNSSSRFTTNKWKMNNELPCPICESWISAANFSRHAKQHEMTTAEIFTIHKEKADEMLHERSTS
ncbi:hypothetical protein ACQKJC_24780 [Priestia koreensis]|uniref:hypothetical protein n=1 Tax=Priestia koreensis TaxID=284581 RepID=UPI003D06B88B